MKLVSILNEAQNYEQLFNDYFKYMRELGEQYVKANGEMTRNFVNDAYVKTPENNIRTHISFAKRVLRKNDRIIWYLRLVKACYFNAALTNENRDKLSVAELFDLPFMKKWAKANPKVHPDDDFYTFTTLRLRGYTQSFEHLLSLPIPEIQNTVWTWQSPYELLDQFHEYEKEWIAETNSQIKHAEDDQILMDFKDGFYWVDLDKAVCPAEGQAMGHCGNAGSPQKGDRILSLRKLVDKAGKKIWVPSLTFILDKNGYLGEMKGRSNQKPNEKYHKYIIPLLRSDLVKGIKGGGYLPENNFTVSDLDRNVAKELVELKPALISLADYIRMEGVEAAIPDLNDSLDIHDNARFSTTGKEITLTITPPSTLFDALMYSQNTKDSVAALIAQGAETNNLLKNDPASLGAAIMYGTNTASLGSYVENFTYDVEQFVKAILPEEAFGLIINHLVSYDFYKYILTDANVFISGEENVLTYKNFIEEAIYFRRNTPVVKKVNEKTVTIKDFMNYFMSPLTFGVEAYFSPKLNDVANQMENGLARLLSAYDGETLGHVISVDEGGMQIDMTERQLLLFVESEMMEMLEKDNFRTAHNLFEIEQAGQIFSQEMDRLVHGVDEHGQSYDGFERVDHEELLSVIIQSFDSFLNSNNSRIKELLQK